MDAVVSQVSISDYLRKTASSRFSWGECDCALWAADLVLERTGTDPARVLRGTYDSAFAARRALMRLGGLRTVVSNAMAGFPAGEIHDGVALVLVGARTFCGILSQGRLWLKTENGLRAPEDWLLIEGWTV